MAAFTSSVGMPLRPNLSIVCTVLLQECPREHLHSTPSVTSSGGIWEHPALKVTSGHLCVWCTRPALGGTPGKEIGTWPKSPTSSTWAREGASAAAHSHTGVAFLNVPSRFRNLSLACFWDLLQEPWENYTCLHLEEVWIVLMWSSWEDSCREVTRDRYGNWNKAVWQGRRLRMDVSCFRIETLLSNIDKEATSSQPVAMQKHVLLAEHGCASHHLFSGKHRVLQTQEHPW